jgi:hypothetical protein
MVCKAFKQCHRVAVIGRIGVAFESEFAGKPDGSFVAVRDHADRAFRMVCIVPGKDCSERLGSKALVPVAGVEHPAGFRPVAERRVELAVEVGETGFAKIGAAGPMLDRPVADAEHGPQAAIAQQAVPAFLGGWRRAAAIAIDRLQRPEPVQRFVVILVMGAQHKPGGFDDGRCAHARRFRFCGAGWACLSSNSSASFSVMAPPSSSASMMVTARW